jgi:hypothetical protein
LEGVFCNWMERLHQSSEMGGEYVEQSKFLHQQNFSKLPWSWDAHGWVGHPVHHWFQIVWRFQLRIDRFAMIFCRDFVGFGMKFSIEWILRIWNHFLKSCFLMNLVLIDFRNNETIDLSLLILTKR